jgi:hypothetical protein
VKAQLDILTLARSFHGINLKQKGPFHRGGCPCCGASEKKEPFQVDPRPTGKKGPHFHCFSCGESGDVFNLFALQQRGDPQIPKNQFIATVRAAAEAYGITIPEAGSGTRRSPEQVLRGEIQTAWASAHEYLRGRFLDRTGRNGTDENGHNRPLGAASRIGIFDDGLEDHLTKLGISKEARARAGLSSEDLEMFAPGVVLLRMAGGIPAGLSQQFANREWVHRRSSETLFEPAFLSSRPSGRPANRVLILVADADRAGRLAANLAALAQADEDEARRVATIGIVAAPFNDPLDLESLARSTKRAVILAPGPDTPTRATSEQGARLFAAGIAVRVAEATPYASGTAPIGDRTDHGVRALDTWDQADDYFAWQAKQIPNATGLDAWQKRRVPALLSLMPDSLMQEVFAYRASQAAEEALQRIGATIHVDANTQITPQENHVPDGPPAKGRRVTDSMGEPTANPTDNGVGEPSLEEGTVLPAEDNTLSLGF